MSGNHHGKHKRRGCDAPKSVRSEPVESETAEEAALGEDARWLTHANPVEGTDAFVSAAFGGPEVDREAESPGDTRLRGGDPDASKQDATFVGEEAPGGGNPTPDQDIVDDIGRASGIMYADDEPIAPEEKLLERDEERWEVHPASSDDYPRRDWERELDTDEEIRARLEKRKQPRPE